MSKDYRPLIWQRIFTPVDTVDGVLFLEVGLTDRNGYPELTICGVAGPKRNGDCRGSCGQCDRYLLDGKPRKDWTPEMVREVYDIWQRWHLNGLRAGSPRQMEFLRTTTEQFPGYPASHYEWAKQLLADNGLQPDEEYIRDGKPYSYGSAWLQEEVPAEVLARLLAMPVATLTHPWGDQPYDRPKGI